MNELQELREHIKAAGFESPSSHARVSAYIETNILNHPNALFKRHVPPLDIILYAIRRVLGESPKSGNSKAAGGDKGERTLGAIPDLLDFVTTVEFYRVLAMQKVGDALMLHEYSQRQARPQNANGKKEDRGDGSGMLLTREEEIKLRTYRETDAELRQRYVQLILQYCQLDIYQLWVHDPPRPADVTLRLCEYFPALNAYYSAADSPRLFHYDLSDMERKWLRERGLACCLFVRDSCRWAAERSGPGHPLEAILRTPEFAARFPCAVRTDQLWEAMDVYMGKVQSMVTELQDMFPADS
ncbi:hypothetical protein B0H11DRAFT_2234123 [Mycena galericulata]|nr:hypothetical protein B0H11DRAFT_2234123 [Mycena galericulata]